MKYDPQEKMLGGFSENDGTIDFYLRINSLINSDFTVLDFGAGRAAWFEDDKCITRRSIRLIKGKVERVIAADLDDAVLMNKASDEQIILKSGIDFDILNQSVDLIVADYVLEHIEDADIFAGQVSKSLKSGGWFCARTPHKFSYVAIIARLIRNKFHTKVLSFIQPDRKEVDVFPTTYELNTLSDIEKAFKGWENKSFIFRADPAYYFSNKIMYRFQSIMHRFLPAFFSGNLFIFVKKP
tara:strand:- start:690 stop:1409 length:720 start_codon:yes stop_codon:yes gene_type:complete